MRHQTELLPTFDHRAKQRRTKFNNAVRGSKDLSICRRVHDHAGCLRTNCNTAAEQPQSGGAEHDEGKRKSDHRGDGDLLQRSTDAFGIAM
jgi:hypothetical protein